MPQAIAAVLVSLGVSAVVASVAGAVIFSIAAKLVTGLLSGGRRTKADPTERTVRSPTPPRIYAIGGERRVYGTQMLFTNDSTGGTVDVFAFTEGPVEAVTRIYLNDDLVTLSGGFVVPTSDGAYGTATVKAGFNLGPATATAHAAVMAAYPTWDATHRGDGIVSGYILKPKVKSEDFLDVYPQGDNVQMSLVIKGRLCHDPRRTLSDPADPATWVHSDNSALLLLWFYMVYLGYDYAAKFAPVQSFWVAAANDSDVLIPKAAGGNERKYRGSVVFDTAMEPKDIEAEIRGTFDGWTGRDEEGCIRVHSGKLYTPTVTIGPDQITSYQLAEFVEEEDNINEIITRYVSSLHDFNTVECDPWRDESDINARGRINSTGLDLQVPSHTQARRLSKRLMVRKNAAQRGQVSVVFSARAALAERYVNLRIEDAGTIFFDGAVEILGGERDYETGGAVLDWVAVDPTMDDWTPATDDGQPAPVNNKFYVPPSALAPGFAVNVSAVGGTGNATISWRNPSSQNFLAVKIYRNTANDFGTATLVTTQGGGLAGMGSYVDTIAAGTYYYWLTTISSLSNEGLPVATGAVTVT